MLNDRSDKHDEHEESEYHFSDDDVSYEVEPETAKSVSSEPKESMLNRLTRSKRMLISLVVFLVLVFVVYKMVAPNATSVAQITPPVVTETQQAMPAQAAAAQPQPAAMQPAAPAAPMAGTEMSNAAPQQQQPPAMSEPAMTPPSSPEQAMAQNYQPPAPAQAMASNGQMAAQPQSVAMPGANPPAPPAPVQAAQQANPAANGMAATVPAGSAAVPGSQPPQSVMIQPGPGGQPPSQPPAQVVTTVPIAQVSANATPDVANQQMLGQMQADYTQKMNDYAAQTKFVQDQMQALSARVAVMESQLNQLVQNLTRPSLASPPIDRAPAPTAAPVQMTPPPTIEPKVGYSVQAIIPGRAWLKSDSGETVTVAEGDVIKELGRVTKIDPYDGVVEVNTGSRTVSISYGNGN